MIKRRYMRTRQLKPGMIIDQVIKDPTGRNLVVQGSAIDDYIISSLLKLGIMSVYIREGNADPDDPDAILSPKAAAMVKQLRTDDRSKVTLSDSVRQRVSTGVQYIFHASGYAGGLTPLLDKEGRPVVSAVQNEE